MNPALKRLRRFIPSLVVAIVGASLTLGIFVTLRNHEGRNARAAFDSVARERLDGLATNVALTLNNLISVGALFDESRRVDRAGFARFASALLGQNRAIQALEWIPRVRREERSKYEGAARHDGFLTFEFTERGPGGTMARANDREEYYPVFYVEPFHGNEKALGYDLASNQARREALERSAATGQMIATSRVVLVQETADQYGALVFYPVYRGGMDPHDAPRRGDQLMGFALGVFRIQDIVESAGAVSNPASGLRVAIFDRDAKAGERLLYPKGAHFDAAKDVPQAFRTQRDLPVAGRTWEVVAYPLDQAFRPARWSSWAALAAGLLATTLLAVYLAERRSAEEALQFSEERARLLFAVIPIPVWVYDLSTLGFLEVNEAAVQHYGYSRDAFLSMKITDIRPPEELERLFKNLRQGRPTKEFSSGWKHRTQDGRIIEVEISSHALLYDGRPASLVVAQDVTARTRLEVELRQAQKLEAVGSLAAGIAHEINTPIQFVGDNVHFLQGAFGDLAKLQAMYQQLREAVERDAAGAGLAKEVGEAEKAADLDFLKEEIPKALTQSLEGVTRVATIVRAMKDFAHPESKALAAADLNKALLSTLTVARNELKYVADVETELGELPLVVCNISDLNQVFLNLLVNAAHAIGEAVKGTERKGKIRVRTISEGKTVLISITDTGCGIPEANRSRIFDPFFTTKEVGRGTGQGLSISRSVVVDRHKGSLTFESEIGKGTTFFIRLPFNPGDGGAEANAGPSDNGRISDAWIRPTADSVRR